MGYDYGNARIAAMRGRLLDRAAITRLGDSATASVMVAQLERSPDWAPIMRRVAPLGTDPTVALETAIEYHRSARLGALPPYYDGRDRRFVEALVLPLDAERAVAVLRRRRAGESAEAIASTAVPGALLDAPAVAAMARAPGPAAAIRPLVDRGIITRDDAMQIIAAETRVADSAHIESMLQTAIDRARWARVNVRGDEAAALRRLLEHEQTAREATIVELGQAGPALATVVDRTMRLAMFDALSTLGRRDPLGIGAVAGYVAAVEAQAIRLRAMVARVRARWSAEDAAPYLARNERPAWLAW
jgi:vacuolar-type H+-ATPase subunit C/Vma6